MLYFDALAQDKDPGIKALQDFIRAVQQLLGDLLDGSLLEASDHDVQPPTLFMEFRGLFIIKGGRRHSLDLFLRRNTFNGGNVDVPNRFYLRN